MPQEDAPSSDPVEQEKLPAPSSLPTSLSPEAREALAQHNARRHGWIEQDGAQDRQVSSRWYQRMADLRVSTTDPDATLMLTKNGADMGYHTRLSGRWGQSAYHPDGAGHTDGA